MILALETATDVCGVALVHEGQIVAQRTAMEKNIHSEKLLPMINTVLSDAPLLLKDIDAIAVSIGPGSFTGLRIGLSTAKGLAMAVEKTIIAVPTLDALAYEYYRSDPKQSPGIVCPLIDAKRDEVYFCFYAVSEAGITRRSEYSITSASLVIEDASRRGVVVFVGDGAKKMRTMPELSGMHRCVEDIVCNPASVGIVAEKEGNRLSAETFSTLEPLYIRDFITTQPGRKSDIQTLPFPAAHQTSAHLFKG